MGDPVYRRFEIVSKTPDCTQPAKDAKADKCRVEVYENSKNSAVADSFVLERRGSDFFLASTDQTRVLKNFPNFKSPNQELSDYLIARSEFYKVFGDKENPTDVAKAVAIQAPGLTPLEFTHNSTNLISSFIGAGELLPTHAVRKDFLYNAFNAGVFSYADPKLGPKITETLGQIDKTSISASARERLNWLLEGQQAWNKLWNHIQPAVAKGNDALAKQMKSAATTIVRFLFVNYLYEEQGNRALFGEGDIYQAGKEFFDQMSRLDVDGKEFGDYYEFMRKGLQQLKTPKLPEALQKEFNKRLALVDRLFADAAKNKIAFLANQSVQKAVKESLRLKYGDSAVRQKCLEAILKNLEIKDIGDRPVYEVNISAISTEWRGMAAAPLTSASRQELIGAMNYLLKQLFERNGKMNVFWKTDFEQTDNLYDPVKRTQLSDDSKTLDDLVKWARSQAVETDIDLSNGTKPHVPLRKWTLITEFGIAGLGTAGALGFGFGAQKDPQLQYWGTGGSVILGASGLGAAGGNLLSYGLDVNPKYHWIFDVGGAILGGLAGGLIYYGAAGSPPGPTMQPQPLDPGTRFPVDPYGP